MYKEFDFLVSHSQIPAGFFSFSYGNIDFSCIIRSSSILHARGFIRPTVTIQFKNLAITLICT